MKTKIERIKLIYNPTAGSLRRNPQLIERLQQTLTEHGMQVSLAPTHYAQHASELAHAAVTEQFDCVLVCGGDGTINESIQGLIGTDITLAVFPGGTANVFAKELGLTRNAAQLAEMLARHSTRTISVGLASRQYKSKSAQQPVPWQRYFLLMAGIGLDATIVQSVDLDLKKRIGIGAYVAAGLRFLTRLPLTPFSLRSNGQERVSTFTVIANAANYAACFTLAPQASLTDDKFDICSFNSQSRLAYLTYAWLSLTGRHINARGVAYETAQAVYANSNEQALVQLDGEVVGHLPMQFELIPNALRVIAPLNQT